jgi:DNA-binding NarL/FixJ family response regulator
VRLAQPLVSGTQTKRRFITNPLEQPVNCVKARVARILMKLCLRDRVQAGVLALEFGASRARRGHGPHLCDCRGQRS